MDIYGSAGQGRIPVKKRFIKKRKNIQNIITDNETSDDNTKAIEQLDMEFANMQKDKYRLDSAMNSKDNLQKQNFKVDDEQSKQNDSQGMFNLSMEDMEQIKNLETGERKVLPSTVVGAGTFEHRKERAGTYEHRRDDSKDEVQSHVWEDSFFLPAIVEVHRSPRGRGPPARRPLQGGLFAQGGGNHRQANAQKKTVSPTPLRARRPALPRNREIYLI